MKNMKRLMTVLAGLVLVSSASAASIGGNFGYFTPFSDSVKGAGAFGLGVHYNHSLDGVSAVRGSLNVFPDKNFTLLGIEGSYLRALPNNLNADSNVGFYFGGGLGVDFAKEISIIKPNALIGATYFVNPQFTAYGELAGGFAFLNAGQLSNTALFVHPRIGVIYNLGR